MKKTVVFILVVAGILLGLAGCAASQTVGNTATVPTAGSQPDPTVGSQPDPTTGSQPDPEIPEFEQIAHIQHAYIDRVLYATPEEKEALIAYFNDPGLNTAYQNPRSGMIVLGMLPKDQPRITLEQAEQIFHTINQDFENGKYENAGKAWVAAKYEVNKICGGPDKLVGCSYISEYYYLDDNGTEIIVFDGFLYDRVSYCNTVTGEGKYLFRAK